MALRVNVSEVTTELKVLVDLSLYVTTEVETVGISVDNETVVVEITNREVVLALVVTACSRKTILMTESRASHLVLPVDIVALAVILLSPYIIIKTFALVLLSLANHSCELVDAESLDLVRESLDTEVGSHSDFRVTLLTVLCSNHDNTIGTF